jgi:pimeloyl-ACP methyl ester carboxylesterase
LITRTLTLNGVELFVVEAGEGPLVLLCHGWPETSFSWRNQIPVLAAAGFRIVAPDMRGFGRSGAPQDIGAYTIFDLVGDMVALVRALGERRAAIVGHDWGAHVAWTAAMFRSDVFHCVAGLSVPPALRAPAPPLQILAQRGVHNFYWQYFQTPGVAEREFEADVDRTMRLILFGKSLTLNVDPALGFLGAETPPALPPWMSETDFAHFVEAFRRTGFRGGLNYYRNIDRNWALTAPWQGAKIDQPALFLAGANDGTIRGAMGQRRLEEMAKIATNLKANILIEGAGHWIQQERAAEVTAALTQFLKDCA